MSDTDPKATAKQKRAQTMALKKRKEAIQNEYTDIGSIVPTQWFDSDEEKKALLKSVHTDLLGLDDEGNARPLTDLKYFLLQSAQRGLNPFKGQIHGVYIWDSNIKGKKLVVITGIGGFRAIAQRSPRPMFAGTSEPEWVMPDDDPNGLPISAKVSVYAYNPITGAREVVTTAVAWFDEYKKEVDVYENNRKTGEKKLNATWERSPKLMIAKCAEAMALRAAYPEDLSGLYVQEEIDHMQPQREVIEGDEADKSREDKIREAVDRHKNAAA